MCEVWRVCGYGVYIPILRKCLDWRECCGCIYLEGERERERERYKVGRWVTRLVFVVSPA